MNPHLNKDKHKIIRVAAISDTHDMPLNDATVALLESCDHIIHAGDFCSPAAYAQIKSMGKLTAVYGNSDSYEVRQMLTERNTLELGGVRIGVAHRAQLSQNDTTGAYYLAKEMDVDCLVFGHTHTPVVESSDILLVCPGSPTTPRMADPSIAVLTIKDSAISCELIPVGLSSCDYIQSMRSFK